MRTTVAGATDLLSDLQTALNHGTVARRVETLRRVTDLFLYAPSDYSDEQIALFDDVFHCLIRQMEASAKVLLAQRLAPIAQAPAALMSTLAFDDLAEVAAPVLSHSERLNDDVLVKTANTKSQAHLLAISRRKALSHAVTDVLVVRGNETVVESTLNNPGAVFSEHGYDKIVSRMEQSESLTSCLGKQPIPRHHYLRLVAKASEAVRVRLNQSNPDCGDEVTSVVRQVRRMASGAKSEQTRQAQNLVESLHQDGRLNEGQITAFAQNGRVEEMTAAIALMTNVPTLTVENMMIEPRAEGILVLSKIAGLSWTTVEKILDARRDVMGAGAETNIEEYKDNYNLLRVTTANQVLRFYRMREATEQDGPAS
jgi:uncharacterized protein (DUF2336 family)